MAKKITWLGMLATVLAFGMAVVACDDGTDGDGGIDPALNGTWVTVMNFGEGFQLGIELRLNNGSWEQSYTTSINYTGTVARGTYTTNGDTYNSITTHMYGNYVVATFQYSQAGSGWLTMEQFSSALERHYRHIYPSLSEEEIDTRVNSQRNPSSTTTYSAQGNTLTFGTTIYTRRQ